MQHISRKYNKIERYIGICSYLTSFFFIFIFIMKYKEYEEMMKYFGWGKHRVYDLVLGLSISILIYVFRMTFLIKNAKVKKICLRNVDKVETFYKVILAPICEEILYRNLLLADILENHNFLFAAFVVSLIFAISHLQFDKFLYFFASSFIFSCLFYMSGSILYTILSHMLYNFLCCVIVVQTDSDY